MISLRVGFQMTLRSCVCLKRLGIKTRGSILLYFILESLIENSLDAGFKCFTEINAIGKRCAIFLSPNNLVLASILLIIAWQLIAIDARHIAKYIDFPG